VETLDGAGINLNQRFFDAFFPGQVDRSMMRLRRFLSFALSALACLALLAVPAAAPVRAQEAGGRRSHIDFIRDAEIEHYLRELVTPIFRAAEIDPASVNLVLIKDSTINAFVAGGMNMFLYTGLLQITDSPEQLVGVMAHETGHIAGGHLIRGSAAMESASAEAIIGTLLGVAAGVAAGRGDVAIGAIGGAQQVAERNFLSFSRMQEASADAAGMHFLDVAGITTRGMMEFMEKLADQELLPPDRQAEYVRTHPLTQDRVDTIKYHLEHSPLADKKLDPKFAVMHERMKAKLLGFLQPETALLRYTDKDPRLPARYARAIALYQTNQLPRALTVVDTLLRDEPDNPFFMELKAQMLFENGHVEESVGLYKQSVALQPDSALLRVAYAHAMLESKNDARLDSVIQQLTEANRLEEREPETWRYLAAAWGRKAEISKNPQDEALVSYGLAEEALARGADREAKQFADRALKGLPKASPYYLRAQDIKLSVDLDEREHR